MTPALFTPTLPSRAHSAWYDCAIMKKVAITLTDQQAEAIERIQRRLGVPRSHVIQHALAYYLASRQALDEADEAYELGYRAEPERINEIEAYARTAAEVLPPEEWR